MNTLAIAGYFLRKRGGGMLRELGTAALFAGLFDFGRKMGGATVTAGWDDTAGDALDDAAAGDDDAAAGDEY